jgi:hypothetical protein
MLNKGIDRMGTREASAAPAASFLSPCRKLASVSELPVRTNPLVRETLRVSTFRLCILAIASPRRGSTITVDDESCADTGMAEEQDSAFRISSFQLKTHR